jgi:Mrp family chromosome partitioning ATPase
VRRAEDDLYNVEEELAGQRLRVKLLSESDDAKSASNETPVRVATAKDVQRYQSLVSRVNQLRQHELDLLSKYTPAHVAVRLNQEQIDTLEKQKTALEEKFPEIARSGEAGSGLTPTTLASEKARLAELEAKATNIRARVANIREGIRKLSDVGSQIAELERNQELEIANYKYFKGTLEKARIDEALDPSKMPNISAVQRPSPPVRVYGKRDKTVKALAGSGFGLAVALVLLKELLLNHTVKRTDELEARLGTRVLVSVPYSGKNRRRRLPWKRRDGDSALVRGKNGAEIPPWESTHFIRPYAAAIRDRLGLYFELHHMTHKPKLVGVTGFRQGGGISTLAAGLAAALSEVGEGKVLLVDVNLGPGEVHPFFNGRPALPLTAALTANGSLPSAADNLYLATVGPSASGVAQLGLKKFFDLMPNLQASDFDYVIFDMPPLGQTSPSLGIAGFMDKVLLVVEAERTNRDTAKRGYEALRASRDNVSVVINKTRSYVPKWLEGDN